MNQHPQLASLGYNGMPTATAPDFGIKDVWASNMEEEFKKVRQIVQKYPYVAMVSGDRGLAAYASSVSFGHPEHCFLTVWTPKNLSEFADYDF